MIRRLRVTPAVAAAVLVAVVPAAAAAASPDAGGANDRAETDRAGGYRLYFGDLHNHTAFTDGATGTTPDDAFVHARASGADWLSTSDHNFKLRQTEWATTKQMPTTVRVRGSSPWPARSTGSPVVSAR